MGETQMTIRTVRQGTFEIKSEPHEDPLKVEWMYQRELKTLGHEFGPSLEHPATPDYTIRCTHCFMTARVYHVDSVVAIFSDFGEEGQCRARQMNVLGLLVPGTST